MQKPQEKHELSPLTLWSPLQRRLSTGGQTKGTPQQWIGLIRNLQQKGVSATEIEWSNIIPTLEKHSAQLLHVNELLAFLADKSSCKLVLQRLISNEYTPLVNYFKQQKPPKPFPITIRNGQREIRLLHYMDRTFGLCIWLHVEVDIGLFGRHNYWLLSVPRGRKKLTPDPVRHGFSSAGEAMAYGRVLVKRMAGRLAKEGFIGQAKNVNQFTRYVLPGGEQYTEWFITAPNLSMEYWGPHFDIPNIVAHVRTTLRTTPQGKRLLVLEEIQSDWNQELREAIREATTRHPVKAENNNMIVWDDDMNPPPTNPYLNHWLEAALKMMLLLAADQNHTGIAWLPGKLHAERFPWANAEGLKTFYDHIVPTAVEKLAKSWGAQLEQAQITTTSRHFVVQKVAEKERWLVFNMDSGLAVSEEFIDQDKADELRKSMEVPVLETVTALYVTDGIRADILKNGLPYLGAVGKRQVAGQQNEKQG